MTPRTRNRTLRRVVLGLAALGAATAVPAHAGRPSGPELSLPLEALGFTALPTRFLSGGATLFTLHFVDSRHVLFTFHTRTLMARLPDAAPEDNDRNVTAELVELPTGKILAKTMWRTRDHEQYLWPLSDGRFLLRIRTRLSVIDPLRNLAEGAGEAFREQPFAETKRRIALISISPGAELVAIETAPPRKAAPVGGAASAAALAGTVPGAAAAREEKEAALPRKPEIEIELFRLEVERAAAGKGKEGERLVAHKAGHVLASTVINVAATAEGFLDLKKESQSVWLFDFQSHVGKRVELSPYETTCTPRAEFVSRSEFIAFGCRGSVDKQEVSGFNLRGEEPWIQVFADHHVHTQIVPAPAAGRFAMSRVLVSSTLVSAENLLPDESTQDISVMQMHDGHVLLKVQASPVERTGQNFDLSPDGRKLAVLRGGKLEVYGLPGLSAKDSNAVRLAMADIPEKNTATVNLGGVKREVRAEPAVATGAAAASAPSAATSSPAAALPGPATPPENSASSKASAASAPAVSAPAVTARPQETLGDAPGSPDQPRKAPSLYDADHPKEPKF